MTQQDLGAQIIALTPTLHRVSCGLLNRPADREDAVQSAIEKAWRKAQTLRDPARLKGWLVRILINECHTLGRRHMREIPVDELPQARTPDTSHLDALREGVLALPEIERVPILLHYMEGFSIQEIAGALRCPRGTVLSRMNRGRKHLRQFLTEEET